MRLFLILLLSFIFIGTAQSVVNISTYVVDGVYNNPEVVIYNRNPIFSWEYDGIINSFLIQVSTNTQMSSPIWTINTTTNPQNTANLGSGKFRTYVDYGGGADPGVTLLINSTYYWNLVLFEASGSSTAIPSAGGFLTVNSKITLQSNPYDIQVDLNNPFNPVKGQITKFRYIVNDNNRRVKVRIYNMNGEFIKTVAEEHLALKKREYTATWDGTDVNGNIVPSGIYLVNLNASDLKGVTRRVVLIKK